MELSMGQLVANEISHLIAIENLISGYVDYRKQMQPSGFDVTLQKVLSIPDVRVYGIWEAKQVFESAKEYDITTPLQSLKPYLLITNETFRMPDDITGTCTTRSTLTRLGIVLGSGKIDPGYVGHLSFSYIATLPIKLEINGAIAQITFERHAKTFKYHGQYSETGVVNVGTT